MRASTARSKSSEAQSLPLPPPPPRGGGDGPFGTLLRGCTRGKQMHPRFHSALESDSWSGPTSLGPVRAQQLMPAAADNRQGQQRLAGESARRGRAERTWTVTHIYTQVRGDDPLTALACHQDLTSLVLNKACVLLPLVPDLALVRPDLQTQNRRAEEGRERRAGSPGPLAPSPLSPLCFTTVLLAGVSPPVPAHVPPSVARMAHTPHISTTVPGRGRHRADGACVACRCWSLQRKRLVRGEFPLCTHVQGVRL